MLLQTDTYQQQSDLAEYCRTNKLTKNLQVRQDRIHHYRRLVFNVVDDSLLAAYPLLNNLLSESEWSNLVIEFFATHSCQSSQIWKMPGEFYEFIKSHDLDLKAKYPHLIDLIYFEWTEIEVFMLEDIEYPSIKTEGDWVNDQIAVNPEHKILQLSYPVHFKNSKSITEADKAEYFLLVFRERETGKVQFIDISALFAIVIENINKGMTLNNILLELKGIINFESQELMMEHIVPFLNNLRKKGFLPGFIS